MRHWLMAYVAEPTPTFAALGHPSGGGELWAMTVRVLDPLCHADREPLSGGVPVGRVGSTADATHRSIPTATMLKLFVY